MGSKGIIIIIFIFLSSVVHFRDWSGIIGETSDSNMVHTPPPLRMGVHLEAKGTQSCLKSKVYVCVCVCVFVCVCVCACVCVCVLCVGGWGWRKNTST